MQAQKYTGPTRVQKSGSQKVQQYRGRTRLQKSWFRNKAFEIETGGVLFSFRKEFENLVY